MPVCLKLRNLSQPICFLIDCKLFHFFHAFWLSLSFSWALVVTDSVIFDIVIQIQVFDWAHIFIRRCPITVILIFWPFVGDVGRVLSWSCWRSFSFCFPFKKSLVFRLIFFPFSWESSFFLVDFLLDDGFGLAQIIFLVWVYHRIFFLFKPLFLSSLSFSFFFLFFLLPFYFFFLLPFRSFFENPLPILNLRKPWILS